MMFRVSFSQIGLIQQILKTGLVNFFSDKPNKDLKCFCLTLGSFSIAVIFLYLCNLLTYYRKNDNIPPKTVVSLYPIFRDISTFAIKLFFG